MRKDYVILYTALLSLVDKNGGYMIIEPPVESLKEKTLTSKLTPDGHIILRLVDSPDGATIQ